MKSKLNKLFNFCIFRRCSKVVWFCLVLALINVIFKFNNKRLSSTSQTETGDLTKSKRHTISNIFENINSIKTSTDCTKIKKLDPFDAEIMKFMVDFGRIECKNKNELKLKVNTESNVITLTGYNIDYVDGKEIKNKGLQLGDKFNIIKGNVQEDFLPGSTGVLKNILSNHCIVPAKFDAKKPPEEVILLFNICNQKEAIFFFTKEGFIKHNVTGRCLRPKGGKLSKDIRIVLSDKCDTEMEMIKDGLLHRKNSSMCVHPLWGGQQIPFINQNLCFYPSCENEKRLQFRFITVLTLKELQKSATHNMELKHEFNFIKIGTFNDGEIPAFILLHKKKNLNHVKEDTTDRPNVYIVTLDEVSAMHSKRKLTKTHKFLHDTMKVTEFELYSAITDSSLHNTLIALTGSGEGIGHSIFKTSKENNYASLFVADFPYEGLENIDADYNGVPAYKSMKIHYDVFANKYCMLSQPFNELSFDYLKSFMHTYKKSPKLAVVLFSEMTHTNYNTIGYMDESLKKLFERIYAENNTILIFNSIKGSLAGKFGQIKQGILEYKRPLLQVYISEDLKPRVKVSSKRTNQLSTPADLYATVNEVISKKPITHKHGKSLLHDLPSVTRTCVEAGISWPMCPCQ